LSRRKEGVFHHPASKVGIAMDTSFVKRMAWLILCLVLAFGMFGCAATQVAIEKRNLDVQTKMSEMIFPDPLALTDERAALISVKSDDTGKSGSPRLSKRIWG